MLGWIIDASSWWLLYVLICVGCGRAGQDMAAVRGRGRSAGAVVGLLLGPVGLALWWIIQPAPREAAEYRRRCEAGRL